jgi:hypothetical protein
VHALKGGDLRRTRWPTRLRLEVTRRGHGGAWLVEGTDEEGSRVIRWRIIDQRGPELVCGERMVAWMRGRAVARGRQHRRAMQEEHRAREEGDWGLGLDRV